MQPADAPHNSTSKRSESWWQWFSQLSRHRLTWLAFLRWPQLSWCRCWLMACWRMSNDHVLVDSKYVWLVLLLVSAFSSQFEFDVYLWKSSIVDWYFQCRKNSYWIKGNMDQFKTKCNFYLIRIQINQNLVLFVLLLSSLFHDTFVDLLFQPVVACSHECFVVLDGQPAECT